MEEKTDMSIQMLDSFGFVIFILYSLERTFEEVPIYFLAFKSYKIKIFYQNKNIFQNIFFFSAPLTHSIYALPFAITFCDLELHLLLS